MNENEASADQKLEWEYQEVTQNFRALADIRFKLLALIPPLGGVAIFLLSHLAEGSDPGTQLALALISVLGFLATLGITSYDQRNSELYDGLIARAKFLERELGLKSNPQFAPGAEFRGQFLERPPRRKKLFGFMTMGHDNALAFIYGSVLGAWFFPLTVAFLGGVGCSRVLRFPLGLAIASVMVFAFILGLWRLDPGKGRKEHAVPEEVSESEESSG
jgi:hypothetical protein